MNLFSLNLLYQLMVLYPFDVFPQKIGGENYINNKKKPLELVIKNTPTNRIKFEKLRNTLFQKDQYFVVILLKNDKLL